jgi:hypothetical protein
MTLLYALFIACILLSPIIILWFGSVIEQK